MRGIFALVIMAAVSYAVVEEESGDPAETWDNMCFHCVNEGNMYCTDATKTVEKGVDIWTYTDPTKGKCMEATCKT